MFGAPLARLSTPRGRVAASGGGYAFSILLLVLAVPLLGLTGDVGRLFDPIGDALRNGDPIYVTAQTPFFYAPPWVVLLGAVTWLPVMVLVAAVWAINLAALRVMAGSWLAVGWLAWFPLVSLSLLGATFNLAMAAVIYVAAGGTRGMPSVASSVLMGLAKVSPMLAVHPGNWRRVLLWTAVFVAISLPWLGLWADWAQQLLRYAGSGVGPAIPVPFALRVAVAVPLWLLRRPWSVALAATLAIPAFYWESLVVLLAPLCLYLRRGEAVPVAASPDAATLQPAPEFARAA
jgi:hypothetical protein